MKTRECYAVKLAGFSIRLLQTGVDRFTVEYGAQVTKGLTYNAAATELGASIMHGLACEDLLDNREPIWTVRKARARERKGNQ